MCRIRRLFPVKKWITGANVNTDKRNQVQQTSAALPLFVDACKTGKQYPGNFREAEHITEAINLYAVALRTNKLLKYDAANVRSPMCRKQINI